MLISLNNIRNLCDRRIAMLHVQGYATEGLKEKLFKVPESYDALIAFARSLRRLEKRPDFSYVEPDDMRGIQEARPAQRRDVFPAHLTETELSDKIHGGVLGRMAGCVLGKPLEMSLTLPEIKRYLEAANAWPLNDYVPDKGTVKENRPLRRDCIESTKERVAFVQEDDDINYLVLGLKVLEKHGADFQTRDMAKLWLETVPYLWNWGPEHSRYYLLAGIYIAHENKLPEGEAWEEVQTFLNDGEELIGAMIRGDAFGLVNPGKPARAAEMAGRDGMLTHRKTGLYAEMWVAATIAAAFLSQGPVDAIRAGIEQLPQNSRYAECLRESLQWALDDNDWMKTWERINKKWGHLGHAGTLNESAAIINALVNSVDKKGHLDYEKAICTTVMQGWDTDCSGATAGCIAGVLVGGQGIPDKWAGRLHDTFYTCVATERERSICAFSERMLKMAADR